MIRQKAEGRRQKAKGRRQKAEGKRFLDNFTFRYILCFFVPFYLGSAPISIKH